MSAYDGDRGIDDDLMYELSGQGIFVTCLWLTNSCVVQVLVHFLLTHLVI